MPRITIQPLNETIDADDGVTIMEAAHAHGLYWPTTCGGQGICTSCMCKIDEGAENLDSMGRSEAKTLAEEMGADEAAIARRGLRLACQTRVQGDVTVTKRGVRREDDSLK
jgi:2Fe-2S ferredoxin